MGTALIAISTPLTSTNYFSELTNSKDKNGELIFNVETVTLQCDICNALKRNRKGMAKTCPHVATKWVHTKWRDSLSLFTMNDWNEIHVGCLLGRIQRVTISWLVFIRTSIEEPWQTEKSVVWSLWVTLDVCVFSLSKKTGRRNDSLWIG